MNIFFNPLNYIKMGKYKMKTCGISGKRFKATANNFYRSSTSSDGFHPYQIEFDNFRRQAGISVETTKKLVNLLNK